METATIMEHFVQARKMKGKKNARKYDCCCHETLNKNKIAF